VFALSTLMLVTLAMLSMSTLAAVP
jgi:hypothetical protein